MSKLKPFCARLSLSVLMLVVLAGAGCDANAQAPSAAQMPAGSPTNGASAATSFSAASANEVPVHLLVDRSMLIKTVQKLTRIYITDPSILSAYAVSSNQVLVTAKAPGSTSIVIWDQTGDSQSYVVSSDVDINRLNTSIQESLPGQDIRVESDGSRILLSGVVGTSTASDAAAKLASLYSKDIFNALVINSSRIPQIRLKVRVIEVDRSKLTQFGVNIFNGAGNTLAQTSTLQFPSQLTSSAAGASAGSQSGIQTSIGNKSVSFSNPLNFLIYNSSINVGTMLQDLEDKQILQILAEPTLTTVDGQKASFLSGGEFPFPVVQGISGGLTSISIQFRPYGVKLEFTPQVNIDGTIQLTVTPEVSALDYTNAVSIDGYNIPALSTRRAETTVVLKNGQSFAISGLLDRRTTDAYSRTPGIASIPILGELFKSKSIDHSRTDLVVVVTPEVVDPSAKDAQVSEPNLPIPSLGPDSFDNSLPQKKDSK